VSGIAATASSGHDDPALRRPRESPGVTATTDLLTKAAVAGDLMDGCSSVTCGEARSTATAADGRWAGAAEVDRGATAPATRIHADAGHVTVDVRFSCGMFEPANAKTRCKIDDFRVGQLGDACWLRGMPSISKT
jgi:hypothetical protein